jgi:hypothetical protein
MVVGVPVRARDVGDAAAVHLGREDLHSNNINNITYPTFFLLLSKTAKKHPVFLFPELSQSMVVFSKSKAYHFLLFLVLVTFLFFSLGLSLLGCVLVVIKIYPLELSTIDLDLYYELFKLLSSLLMKDWLMGMLVSCCRLRR